MPLPSFFFDPVVVASLPIAAYLVMNLWLPLLLRSQKMKMTLAEWAIVLGSVAMFALVALAVLRAVGPEWLMIPIYWNLAVGLAIQYKYARSNQVVLVYFALYNMGYLGFSLATFTRFITFQKGP
ncbi:MAG: hypothetical protein QXP31_02260 [Pyrobaculum sp.]